MFINRNYNLSESKDYERNVQPELAGRTETVEAIRVVLMKSGRAKTTGWILRFRTS